MDINLSDQACFFLDSSQSLKCNCMLKSSIVTEMVSKSKGLEISADSKLSKLHCFSHDIKAEFLFNLNSDLYNIIDADAHVCSFWITPHQLQKEWTTNYMTIWKASSASSSKASKCLQPLKDAMTKGLNFIKNKIEECKANNDGKMAHGTQVKIVVEIK